MPFECFLWIVLILIKGFCTAFQQGFEHICLILLPESGENSFTLTSITPAIAMGTYRATTESLQVWPNYSIDGAANADRKGDEEEDIRTVYMAVFNSQEAAEALSGEISKTAAQVKIGANGTATPVLMTKSAAAG